MPEQTPDERREQIRGYLALAGKVLGSLVVLAGIMASIFNFIDDRYVSRVEMTTEVVDMQAELGTQMQQLRQDVRRWMSCGIFQYPQGCEADLQRELSGFPR